MKKLHRIDGALEGWVVFAGAAGASKCETRDRLGLMAAKLSRRLTWSGWKLRTCYVVPSLRRRDYAGRWRSMAFGRAVAPHLGYADCQGRTGLAARDDRRHAHAALLAVV